VGDPEDTNIVVHPTYVHNNIMSWVFTWSRPAARRAAATVPGRYGRGGV